MKELFVIFLIVLVIYLNRSQCKTQKSGFDVTTAGIGFAMAVVIIGAGYFAFTEGFSNRDSPSQADVPGSSDNQVSPNRPTKSGGDTINNYYFTDIGEDVIFCNPNTEPKQYCPPDNVPCPASGVCPSGGGGWR